MMEKILITGGAGFIGSNFVNSIASKESKEFVVLDGLTYAGNIENIEKSLSECSNLRFVKIDIRAEDEVLELFDQEKFSGVIHFAAESHVDNSISGPKVFFDTNVLGTINLLNASLKSNREKPIRFLHVSTDEVYGSLQETEAPFTEEHLIQPNSPYSASKAGSDLAVRSYHETYGLDTIITRCSNNYGPHQDFEKLIPLMIKKALAGEKLPVYGDGTNIRDWIFVEDHTRGVWEAFKKGQSGETYNFGGNTEIRNIDLVKELLRMLDRKEDLISFVEDRAGHDFRYAINSTKAKNKLNWSPLVTFEQGIAKTVSWYKERLC